MIVEYLGSVAVDASRRPARLTTERLPPYAYVPGCNPHPLRSPKGHLYGLEQSASDSFDPSDWRSSTPWLRGVDLCNAFYFWEAHEVWEGLWHAFGRRGDVALLLKSLIQAAAADIKIIQDMRRGVELLNDSALRGLDELASRHRMLCGLALPEWIEARRTWYETILAEGDLPQYPFLILVGRDDEMTGPSA